MLEAGSEAGREGGSQGGMEGARERGSEGCREGGREVGWVWDWDLVGAVARALGDQLVRHVSVTKLTTQLGLTSESTAFV